MQNLQLSQDNFINVANFALHYHPAQNGGMKRILAMTHTKIRLTGPSQFRCCVHDFVCNKVRHQFVRKFHKAAAFTKLIEGKLLHGMLTRKK